MPFPQCVWLLVNFLSPSKFGDEISSFADPGSWIPDPNFFHPESWIQIFPSWIPDPGSKLFQSRILDSRCTSKTSSILTKKMVSQLSEILYGFSIPDLDPDFLPIPDLDPGSQITNPGIKKAPDPWSRIPDTDSQHWRFLVCSGCSGYRQLLTFNGHCCLYDSFNGSALRSFYLQKRIFCIFYFNIISQIFTVFKLWCPAHLFPNIPRTF